MKKRAGNSRWAPRRLVAALAVLSSVLFQAGCPRDQQQVNEHQRVLQSERD